MSTYKLQYIQTIVIRLFFIFLSLHFFTCSGLKKSRVEPEKGQALNELASYMTGNFSSQKQAAADTNYFNIHLAMVPIWKERTDGKWLYVEQASASKLDKPYRQRVYRLQQLPNGLFTSDIYTIENAIAFAGLQNDPAKQSQLTFDKIALKEGCTVTLKKENDIYTGGTHAQDCPSDLLGAKYTTTTIVLKKGELISWDQGFDGSGKQVWGATKGGYVFLRY